MQMTLSPDTVVVPPLGGAAAAPSDTMVEHLPPIAHLTPAERVARGKSARLEVPLASHAVSADDDMRPDPVDILIQQGNDRVTELLPIRYGRMLASPFAFYRGAAAVMAADLAAHPPAGCVPSCAATPTWPTSGSTPPPSGGWCSTSTTSTKRCPARSNGTSNGSPRASASPAKPTATTDASDVPLSAPPSVPTVRPSVTSPGRATSPSGT
jgi:hypothetical protein